MTQSPSSPPAPGSLGAAAAPKRITLRPPAWDRRSQAGAGSEGDLIESLNTPAVGRRSGRADYASLKARLGDARKSKDRRAEAEAAAALGRWLSERGLELDTAVLLARRSLSLKDDAALRQELSNWLVAMGEHALVAADIRRQLEGKRGTALAREWSRAGELLARVGDATAAAEAFRTAAEIDPGAGAPLELLGMLAVWSPEHVTAEVGAAAFGEAALRRQRANDAEAAFEDRLRAHDLLPSDEGAAEALAAALISRGRTGAADEVLRASATLRGEGGVAGHRRRAREALSLGELPRAVGAALDAGLDAQLEGPDATLLDDILARTGLYEQLAARLEVRAEQAPAGEKSGAFAHLARLCAGPLASVDRALDAWIEALAADPGCSEAKAALRAHAGSMRDQGPLVEGLLRGAACEAGDLDARLACLRELLQVAEDSLADPSLALFAVESLAELSPSEEGGLRSIHNRLAARVKLQDDALASATASLLRARRDGDEPARIEALRRLVSLRRGRPREAGPLLEVLRELVSVLPEERASWVMLERVASRPRSQGDDLGGAVILERAYRERLSGATLSRSEIVRARLGLSAILRRRGERAQALIEAAPLLSQASSHRGAASMVVTLAALEGNKALRAEAIAQLAQPLSPALRSLLLACASLCFLDAGEKARARALAEQACQADPTLPRAVQALSASLWGGRDRIAAAALERSAGVLVPSSALCEELASTFEQLGESSSALDWTRRWVALRPGDPVAAAALLTRARLLADPLRLSDAISWVLTLSAPAESLAVALQLAFLKLAKLDARAASSAVRRAADVLGVRSDALREAFFTSARATGDSALLALLCERWLAASAAPELSTAKVKALFELVDARRSQADGLGEARALSRALREGASVDEVLGRIASMPVYSSPDASLARLEAHAEALSMAGPSQAVASSEAFREVGAARWDWAGDPSGAVRAWVRAAELDPRKGPARLVRDLFAFGGPERALDELASYAATKKEPREAALVHALSALAASEAAQPLRAFEAAERAVLLDASHTEALEIAENSAESVGDPARLERLYAALADAAKGRFGRRAAHYRAARQLERRGATQAAAIHAIAAFEAVPSVGMTFVLMSRLAQLTNVTPDAVAAISRVADSAQHDHERATWLRRAAALSTSGEDGARMRADILLRALHVQSSPQTVQDVAEALSTLVTSYGEAHDAAELRFERAQRAALRRLSGPDGARIALAFAAASVRVFGSGQLALSSLSSALEADADVDEYMGLLPEVELLAEAELADPTTGFVAHCKAMLSKPYSNLGPAALRLAGSIAAARRDLPTATLLLVSAARRSPDDNALVAEAERLLALAGDDTLRAQLHDAFPVVRRLESLSFVADERERQTDLEGAIEALERAADLEGASVEQRATLRARLRDLYLRTGRRDALEDMLSRELERDGLSSEERVSVSRELSRLLAARGHADRAAAVLEDAIVLASDDADLLGELVDVARQAGDHDRLLSALAKLADAPSEPEAACVTLRELATSLEEDGNKDEAARRWAQLHALEPQSREVLAAMERLAMDRGDYETLSRVLAARVALGGEADEVRVLRLRRAALLEQRLGRLEDARAELESLLEQSGEDASATRFLADLHERLGAPLRAGPLWMRAFRLQVDPRDRADLAVRAAQAFLGGGDYAQARASLDAALLLSRSERLLELRVDLERRSENPKGLADSLDELAIASMDSPEKRAELLVEAAHASLAAGEEIAGLERAQRAARVAPASAGAQLLARLLEYRVRGAGTPQEASHTIEELRRVTGRVADEQIPLHAFLLAEALDVVHGGNVGMRELSARHAEIGAAPLICLGMAERLARVASFHSSLPFFDGALSGDLQGTRRRGSIALAAAEAAFKTDDLERASRYLEEAVADPATAAAARQRQNALAQALRSRGEAAGAGERRTLQELAQRSVGLERARALGQLARLLANNQADRAEADRLLTDAITIAALDPMLQAELEAERDTLRGVRRSIPPSRPPSVPPPASLRSPPSQPPEPARASRPPSVAPPARVELASMQIEVPTEATNAALWPESEAVTLVPTGEVRGVSSMPPPPASTPMEPRASTVLPPASQALSVPPPVSYAPSVPPPAPPVEPRSASMPPELDPVSAARMAFLANLAEPSHLEALRAAAAEDHNQALVRAVEHVLSAFSPGAQPIVPPPLSAQREEPEFVHRLLLRGPGSTVADALALVWEGASSMFRREAGTYGVTGLDRVSFGAVTVASRVYASAVRLLGAGRTPLFQRRSSGPVTATVALLVPPAVVLAGDPREETPELLYRVGSSLVAASPEFALLFGLPEGQLRVLLAAMVMAFGPTPPSRGANPAVTQLAETLWQTLPPRSQRRMNELCGKAQDFALDNAIGLARRATRRAGLFLSGDIGASLREIVADEGLRLERPLDSFAGLAVACAAHPQLVDLVSLALSSEYADGRFRAADPRQRGRLRANS